MPNMYEYSDGLYDMYTGSFTNHRPLQVRTCSLAVRLTPWFIRKATCFSGEMKKDEKTMHVLLVSLGGLFHDVENRKLAPALWLHKLDV
jgi:hypothetical protein